MADEHRGRKWAELRFAVVGALVAAPPKAGALQAALSTLCAQHWTHPISGQPVRFAFSTIERWYSAQCLIMRSVPSVDRSGW